MSNSEERIKALWEEFIIKEKLKSIIEENQSNNRQAMREELTDLWSKSEIPTFKQILDKLTIIQNCLKEKDKEEEIEIIAVNAIGRIKEPIIMDISKIKPKMTKGVKKVINNLAELHKLGKF